VAVKLAVSVASSVAGVAITLTEGFALLPPQPASTKTTTETTHKEISFFKYTRASNDARIVRKMPVLTFGEWMKVTVERERGGSRNSPDDKDENLSNLASCKNAAH
jgi:hypothetical protein